MDFISRESFADIHKIVRAILVSSIEIEQLLRVANQKGVFDSTNFSGDEQKPLDILANDIMIRHLTETKLCSFLLSEENENAIELNHGPYMVSFDPVDGSSNIDCNVCVGTIFTIYEPSLEQKPLALKSLGLCPWKNLLRSGNEIEMAGYVLYGPATELILATKTAVHHYTLNPVSKEYQHVGEVTLTNKKKKYYSINEGNSENWFEDISMYINQYKKEGYSQRYIGSMVADVHRTLMYGGMFSYPEDKKNPNGKLRLLYECYPMAFITEAAGGEAIHKDKRILDKEAKEIHERTPILLGSAFEVSKYKEILLLIKEK